VSHQVGLLEVRAISASEEVALRRRLSEAVVIPEGAGRCQEGFRPAVLRSFWLLQGMTGWPHGCFLLTAAFSCKPAVRVRDRAFGLAALGGAAGVLDAPAGEPTMGWPGKARQAPGGLWSYARPIAGWSGVAGPLAAVIPSVCPGLAGRGAWGVPRQVRAGSITTASAPPRRSPGCRCRRGTDNEAAARPAGPAAHAAGLAARRTRPSRRT